MNNKQCNFTLICDKYNCNIQISDFYCPNPPFLGVICPKIIISIIKIRVMEEIRYSMLHKLVETYVGTYLGGVP